MGILNHKDSEPLETVRVIRSILADLDIFTVENWHEFSKGCHSVHISDIKLPYLGTNGKGATKPYALAAGYAEFMERLQNRFLVKPNFGLKDVSTLPYPDSTKIGIEQVLLNPHSARLLDGASHVLLKKIRDKIDYFTSVPYYHVNSGSVVFFPDDLVSATCFSNGCSAGNTPEEAILQGLCEVLERYVMREIYYGQLTVPTIPFEEVKHLAIGDVIKGINKKGYQVIIKDCTMQGVFPVLAVIILNSEKTHYKINFGCDPLFQTALLRCLTEISQGLDADSFESALIPIQWIDEMHGKSFGVDHETDMNFLRYVTNASGQFPFNIFACGGVTAIDGANGAFVRSFNNHQKLLSHVLKLIIERGFDIYVRDVSFLGFPAYRIYVPGMSEQRILNDAEMRYVTYEALEFRRTLLRLRTASAEELKRLVLFLDSRLDMPRSGGRKFYDKILQVFLDSASDIYAISPIAFVALLYLCVRDYAKAFDKLLQSVIRETHGGGIEGKDDMYSYYTGLLFVLRLIQEGMPQDSIYRSINLMYGQKTGTEILQFLAAPESVFEHYKLPYCDDCTVCPVQGECLVDVWAGYERKIFDKMCKKEIQQEHLSQYLAL